MGFSTLNVLRILYDRYIEEHSSANPESEITGYRLMRAFERAKRLYPDSELVKRIIDEDLEETVFIGICPVGESWE